MAAATGPRGVSPSTLAASWACSSAFLSMYKVLLLEDWTWARQFEFWCGSIRVPGPGGTSSNETMLPRTGESPCCYIR